MTDITNIPLNKLTAWEGNVRKTQNKAGIDELAASIEAHGLQQILVVRKDGKKFAVVAGKPAAEGACNVSPKAGNIERRLRSALPVSPEAADATEISLAENVVREDMHPADQFEAFRDLCGQGHARSPISPPVSGKASMFVKHPEARPRQPENHQGLPQGRPHA